jgi:hypothetical protein
MQTPHFQGGFSCLLAPGDGENPEIAGLESSHPASVQVIGTYTATDSRVFVPKVTPATGQAVSAPFRRVWMYLVDVQQMFQFSHANTRYPERSKETKAY